MPIGYIYTYIHMNEKVVPNPCTMNIDIITHPENNKHEDPRKQLKATYEATYQQYLL